MRGLAGAIASLVNIGVGGFAEPSRTRKRAYFAPFNTEADAARAVKRAKRWLRNKSKGPLDRPPQHIYQNAELAVAQFGDSVAD